MVFGEVNAAISLWDRIRKWWQARKNPLAESIATRFVRLFESHGVHRNQIPRFIGHGLTLTDVQDDASLLAKLDETILDDVCGRFAVRREWLDGAETQVHPCYDFYKHPEDFADIIKRLKANNPDGGLLGVLIAPDEPEGHAEALLVLQETIGFVGDKAIYRYHLCNNWGFEYWKSRAYLAACVAIAWKHDVFVHGIYSPSKEIQRLVAGDVLLGWQGEGVWSLGVKKWDPEDMALRPDVFLRGVDPEQEAFGYKAGLQLWLDLEQRGLMDTGDKINARRLFEQELAKYSP